MPLNPSRGFNTVIEGALRLNEEGLWALYDGDEELTYWDEGQQLEVLDGDQWLRGEVAWVGEDAPYVLALPDGQTRELKPGEQARRRVGGSI